MIGHVKRLHDLLTENSRHLTRANSPQNLVDPLLIQSVHISRPILLGTCGLYFGVRMLVVLLGNTVSTRLRYAGVLGQLQSEQEWGIWWWTELKLIMVKKP